MIVEPNGGANMSNGEAVDASSRVAAYFSRQAADYQADSARFPWAWVRSRETAAIRSLLGDVAGADVLEFGSGAGFYTRELVRLGACHVWAVDCSAAMLAALPNGPVSAVLGDAQAIRLHRRFPVLLCAGMLEFVPDPAPVLANAARHAEAGARFVLLVPRANALGRAYRRFHRGHGLRIHLFDPVRLGGLAARSGWHVDTIVAVFPFSLAVRLHLT
jgi:SAM-dependent methyltransferase